MVYDDILQYFGQQNFAAASTTGASSGLQILYNRVGYESIFCILVNHSLQPFLQREQFYSIQSQLAAQTPERNILFILVTGDVERDKALTQNPGLNIWLVDTFSRELFIYENQPDDFFGLRYGLQQTISETPQAKTHKALQRKNWPFVTIGLIAINVIWFLVLAAGGDVDDASYMLEHGASYSYLIFDQYQFWRLITSMFMHFGISHLLGNMVYLGVFGYSLERTMGHIRYLLLYLLAGFGASLASAGYYYLSGGNIVSAGASGAIYGLIGATVYLMIKNRGRMRPGALWLRIGIILIFLFYSNITDSGVDAVAHAAGFVFGIILAFPLIGGKKT